MKLGQRISGLQLGTIMFGQTIAFGLLIFPKDLTDFAEYGAVYALLVGASVAAVSLFVFTRLATAFPDQTVGEYLQVIFGRPFGKVLIFFITLAHTFWLAVTVRLFADLFSAQMLRETPLEVVAFALLLTASYIALHGIETLGRFAVLVVLPSILLVVIIQFSAWINIDLVAAKPLMIDGILPILKGAGMTYYIFMGLQVYLVAATFTTAPGITRVPFIVLGGLVGLLLLVTITANGVYGVHTVHRLNWPGLAVLRLVLLSGIFIERLGLIILVVWTVLLTTTCAILLWGLSIFSAPMFGFDLGKARYLIFPFAIVSYWTSIVLQNYNQVNNVALPIVSGVALVSALIIPTIMLVIAKVRRLGV